MTTTTSRRAAPSRALPTLLAPHELARYSLMNAVCAADELAAGRAPLPSFELEVSRQLRAADTYTGTHDGVAVPLEVLAATDTGPGGGYAVDSIAVGPFQPVFRRSFAERVGVNLVTGLVGTGSYVLPGGSTAPSGGWVGSEVDVPEGDTALRAVQLSPHSWGTYVDVSRRVFRQTGGAAEAMMRLELARAAGAAVESAVLTGSGGRVEPFGLLADGDVPSIALGTDGAAPTRADLVKMLGTIGGAASAADGLAWVTNNKVRTQLLATANSATTGDGFVWEPATVPGADGALLGLPAYCADAVPNDLVKGSSGAVCSAILLGPWRELVVGVWGNSVDLVVDRASLVKSGGRRVFAFLDVDVAPRRKEAFCVVLDALTPAAV